MLRPGTVRVGRLGREQSQGVWNAHVSFEPGVPDNETARSLPPLVVAAMTSPDAMLVQVPAYGPEVQPV
jgi:hypothetical protein